MDTGALSNLLRRPVTAANDAAHGRISLNLKLAIDVVAAQGVRADLLRELHALAAHFPTIRLVQSPGTAARLQAGPHRFEISAALRDALLNAVATREPAPAAAGTARSAEAQPTASKPADATGNLPTAAKESAPVAAATGTARVAAPPVTSSVARSAIATVDLAAASSATAGERAPPAATQPTALASAAQGLRNSAVELAAARWALPLAEPLIAGESMPASVTAARLQAAVRDSGLFIEPQLARAVHDRDTAVSAAHLRESARMIAEAPPADRAVAQLELLRRDAVTLSLPAWTGQPLLLELVRERADTNAGGGGGRDEAPVFAAVLVLDLPALGPVRIRLRLLNATLASTIEAADPRPWQDALPDLAAALRSRGLQPVALQAQARPPEVDHASA